MKPIRTISLAIFALILTSISVARAGVSDLPTAPTDLPSTEHVSELPHNDVWERSISDGMSLALTDALVELEKNPVRQLLNIYEWNADKGILLVHAFGDIGAMPAGSYEIIIDPYSLAELSAEADKIARKHFIAGIAVAHAGPLVDGSGIEVGIIIDDSDDKELTISRVEAAISSKYPVTVVATTKITAIDRQYQEQPYWGGAYISSQAPGTSGYTTCSSGFAVIQPGVPYHKFGMLFADHCGDTGSVWGAGLYSNSPFFGTAQYTSAGGSDIKILTPGTNDATYLGVNFYGSYNTTWGVPISAPYNVPVVYQNWCINGSQSGTVCNNTVTSGPQTVNFSDSQGNIHSYSNEYRSVQLSNTPAAGNGDSGGPVFRIVDGEVRATGIISGIQHSGDSCTGKPATNSRKCSDVVWTAGIDAFFTNNLSWQILTYSL